MDPRCPSCCRPIELVGPGLKQKRIVIQAAMHDCPWIRRRERYGSRSKRSVDEERFISELARQGRDNVARLFSFGVQVRTHAHHRVGFGDHFLPGVESSTKKRIGGLMVDVEIRRETVVVERGKQTYLQKEKESVNLKLRGEGVRRKKGGR